MTSSAWSEIRAQDRLAEMWHEVMEPEFQPAKPSGLLHWIVWPILGFVLVGSLILGFQGSPESATVTPVSSSSPAPQVPQALASPSKGSFC